MTYSIFKNMEEKKNDFVPESYMNAMLLGGIFVRDTDKIKEAISTRKVTMWTMNKFMEVCQNDFV